MGFLEFKTLSELFLRAVEAYSKPDAFLYKSQGQYQRLASREALHKVAGLAAALERSGIHSGDRVAILSENRLEWALTDYALLGLGVISVPIYPTLPAGEIEILLRDSGSVGAVVSTEAQLHKVLSARPRLPDLKVVLSMDPVPYSGSAARYWHKAVGDELNRFAGPVEPFCKKALEVKPSDLASILYTSGTMGEPKGVMLTHANIVANIKSCRSLFPLGVGDVGMSILPLAHILERMLEFYCFAAGVSIAYAESAERLAQNLLEVRPTMMAVVPRVLEKIQDRISETVRQSSPAKQKLFRWSVGVSRDHFAHRLAGRVPHLGLRLRHVLADRLVGAKIRAGMGGRLRLMISGAAPLTRELAEFFHAVGLPVYEGYGLTETSPVISVNYPGRMKLGTVGPVIPGVEVKLGEPADEEGVSGQEILVRGANVTSGYFHRDDDTRAAFVDGWFRTGDLGTLDAEGFLTITGRRKTLFKTSGGKYVAPEKLESLFQGNPYVAQILVVGEARRFVSALIVPRFERLEELAREQGIAFRGKDDLAAHPAIRTLIEKEIERVTEPLAPHEKIRQFALLPQESTVSSGEMTPSLKIKRRVLEARYREMIEAIYRREEPGASPAHGFAH